MTERDPLNAELDELRAEIEKLRAESDISDGLLADAKAEVERWRSLWDDQMREKNVLAIENERLKTENIDRLMQKVKLEDEIRRLQSSPTSEETDALITQLQQFSETRYGQEGCDLSREAAEALHRLSRNQISASSVTMAQAGALQAQRADKLERGTALLTNALLRAMGLMDELMRENGRLCALSPDPPDMTLFTAKANFDTAMHELLGEQR